MIYYILHLLLLEITLIILPYIHVHELTCVILQSSEKFTEAIQTALGDIKNMFLESKKL
jgi:hypothetical protein